MPGSFEELEAYKAARKLRQRVYKLVQQLPKDEKFILSPQMRRAALSVTNNIAEGHGSFNWKHEISYLYRARGSINELIDDLGACEDQGYFKAEHLADLRNDANETIRIINGYISYLQDQLKQYMSDKRAKQQKNAPSKQRRPRPSN